MLLFVVMDSHESSLPKSAPWLQTRHILIVKIAQEHEQKIQNTSRKLTENNYRGIDTTQIGQPCGNKKTIIVRPTGTIAVGAKPQVDRSLTTSGRGYSVPKEVVIIEG